MKVTQPSLTSWSAASFVFTAVRVRGMTSAKLPALARSSSAGRKRNIRSPPMETAVPPGDAPADDIARALAVALRAKMLSPERVRNSLHARHPTSGLNHFPVLFCWTLGKSVLNGAATSRPFFSTVRRPRCSCGRGAAAAAALPVLVVAMVALLLCLLELAEVCAVF